MLERYFHRVAMESEEYTRLGRWWDRKVNIGGNN